MKTRRILASFLFLALFLAAGKGTFAGAEKQVCVRFYDYAGGEYGGEERVETVEVRLNGAAAGETVPAVVWGGRTLAPLRLLAEKMGVDVSWSQETAQVKLQREETVIVLTLGSAQAVVNGETGTLPDGVPATTMFYEGAGYTMVPLRFFSEALGCEVSWDQERFAASIWEAGYIEKNLTAGLVTPKNAEEHCIVLDAGHGGKWTGAYYSSVAEKELNLAITRKVEEILRALGYRTILTRSGDENVELLERAKIANRAEADLFISIHCNAAENAPNFQGLYVYHFPGSIAGSELAQTIQTEAVKFSGAIDRGIASANFSVLRNTGMPAVLVETGFMSCQEELTKLMDEGYQTKLARGIAQGIIRYLNTRV